MRWHKLQVLAAIALWAGVSSGSNIPHICPRTGVDVNELGSKLSSNAKVYLPGSAEFAAATTRWSNLEAPQVNIVVVPGTENDVAEAVKIANKYGVPFLAYNGVHGALTSLGKMDYGIEIYLQQLNTIEIAIDGTTAKIGGGTQSKLITDTLWAAGKQTVTGTCECVSYLGPALGGGHGWLQGRHGLVSDQFVSLDIVLADGSTQTIDSGSDLWWAVHGAGHNFGIVTSVTSKIYDIEHSDWAVETFIFSGEKVEEVYAAANEHFVGASVDIINWSYWLRNPDADPVNPIILFWVIQEGVTVVDPIYTKPFYDIGPLSGTPTPGTYRDLAAWTGVALDSPPCQNIGGSNPRFPVYVEAYNVTAQRKAYDLFASSIAGDSPFNNSLFLFEGYSVQGVQAVDSSSTAFAYRGDNMLFAPLITYTPTDTARDLAAAELGNDLREIIRQGTGRSELHAYVNYAYGDEGPEVWYGSEQWRQIRLKSLKTKYDPSGKFSFYAPIA